MQSARQTHGEAQETLALRKPSYLNRNEEAWDVLCARYRNRLIGYFINKGVDPVNPDDAE